MTHLTAAITVHQLDQALSAAALAAESGADLVEYRIDQFTDDRESLGQLIERSPLPCIITCRLASEGGGYDGDEQTRISLIEHLGVGVRQPAYFDIELAAYQSSANLRQKVGLVVDHPGQVRPVTTGLILSSHDFQTRPADLYQRVEHMAAVDACRVIKVAWRARSLRDNIEAFEIIMQHHKPTIALCMGEAGLPSRVLTKKFGGLLTFAAVDDQPGTAPGQPTVRQLKQLYRWDAINADTQVYGVIGDPIAHSKSPLIHNAGFDETGYNGVYLPMRIPPEYEHFKATVVSWLDYKPLDFRGASVTLPHKENLIRFVREMGGEVEPLSEQIGAANTLAVRADGSLYACNTDYAAALDSVCGAMGSGRGELAGKRVAVIGAGGVARAIVAGFAHHGATVVIYNRTYQKAQRLADAFGETPGRVVAARLEKLCDSCCEVYINCTSVGMHPNIDASPFDAAGRPGKGWGPGTVVFDTIYNPLETRLLREAKADGCTAVNGLEMFVRQAAAQFNLWTDHSPPIDLFRRTMTQQTPGASSVT